MYYGAIDGPAFSPCAAREDRRWARGSVGEC